jgi:aerotaxis receptor
VGVLDVHAKQAQRTSQSTTQIHGLITQLQASSNNAVQSMENGQRQAQEGVAWVLEADQALVGISEAVSHITDMTTQIAAATEEQSA